MEPFPKPRNEVSPHRAMQNVSILDGSAIVICWTTVLSRSFESGFWFDFRRYQKKVLENSLFLIRYTRYALSSR